MADFDESLLDDQTRTFSSVEDELSFWKTRSERLKTALVDTRTTLEEFQQDSRDYEDELERNVELLDEQGKELRGAVNVLQIEADHWKEKFQESKTDSNSSLETMQREINFLKSAHEKFKNRTRTLEQDNDDLERYGRVAATSLKDVEVRLHQALERNAFLENELEVKNKLVVVVQRLKDELRDVQLELSVLRSSRVSDDKRRSLSIKPEDNGANPVKMVQEMLGRVKNLESRLVNCRSLVTPLLTPPPSYTSSTNGSAASSLSGIKKPMLSTSSSPTPKTNFGIRTSTPSGRPSYSRASFNGSGNGNRSLPSSPVSGTPTSSIPSPGRISGSTASKMQALRARSTRGETPSGIRRPSNVTPRATRV